VTGPGQLVTVDITGLSETSKGGNRYLLTYIDHFTKWIKAVALPNQEAATIRKAIVTKIFSRHGVCETLLSDRGKNCTSSLLKETCQLLGARKIFTSPCRQQCNGQVENFHRTLHQGLACSIEAGRGRRLGTVDGLRSVGLPGSTPQRYEVLTLLSDSRPRDDWSP
jgi:transposase InsO family protein